MAHNIYDYGDPMSEEDVPRDPSKDIPIEQSVDRIPSLEDQEKIKSIIKWADLIHEQAHSPWGINWQMLHVAVIAMGVEAEWAREAEQRIHYLYRLRIDAPMDETELKGMSDHFPEDWS